MTFKSRLLTASAAIARLLAVQALLVAPAVFANSLPVNMELTGTVNNQTLGGVYVNPYTATVNGAVTTIICNDFDAETFFGETWQASVTTLDVINANPSLLSNLRFGATPNALALYNQAAWLSLQLLDAVSANDTINQGRISYAIWGLFTPSSLSYIYGSDRSGAESWISLAQASGFVGGSQFSVYTAINGTAYLSDGSAASMNPQEFISVRTPESSAIVMLTCNFAAVLAFVYGFRRRLFHPVS